MYLVKNLNQIHKLDLTTNGMGSFLKKENTEASLLDFF